MRISSQNQKYLLIVLDPRRELVTQLETPTDVMTLTYNKTLQLTHIALRNHSLEFGYDDHHNLKVIQSSKSTWKIQYDQPKDLVTQMSQVNRCRYHFTYEVFRGTQDSSFRSLAKEICPSHATRTKEFVSSSDLLEQKALNRLQKQQREPSQAYDLIKNTNLIRSSK